MSTSKAPSEKSGKILIDGHHLRVADVTAAARGACRPAVALAPGTTALIARSNELKDALVEAGVPIYGVTSGFGDSCSRQISGKKSGELQKNLIRFLSCGTGRYAEPDVVRATLLIRANCLARGHSGVRPELVELLIDCLNRDVLPLIPELGAVGASGDLVPLSYVAAVLTGEGTVLHRGERKPAAVALADCGLSAIELRAKEGLALVNGTSFMSAFAVLALEGADQVAFAADLCTALASQVLCGNPGHFAAFVYDQKPHDGAVESARTIRQLLNAGPSPGPDLGAHGAPHPPPGYRELEHPIQDRYSIRCAPHVTGVLRDTISWAVKWLTIEINSSNDNPLFDVARGVSHNGGNFYGAHVGQAMDALKVALASVGDLLDRQLELAVDEKFNNGLTPNLIPRFEADSWDAGLHHGFKGMQLTASALAAEALKCTTPATSFSRSTEAHNQDKVSMGTIAARDARWVVELACQIAAIHLIALCQAADLRGIGRLSRPTIAAYEVVREVCGFLSADRPMEREIQGVTNLIRSGELRRAVAEIPFSAAFGAMAEHGQPAGR